MPGGDPNEIGNRLRAAGWRSGSVLTADHVQAIALLLCRAGEDALQVTPNDWLIVVSQTCDILVPELHKEPYVEVLYAQMQAAVDHTIANLRSTRWLSFRCTEGGQVLKAHGTDRFWLPKSSFDKWEPDAIRVLSPIGKGRLSRWLGMRYTRFPWPDSLVMRLKGSESRLKKILREVNMAMAELRVSISNIDIELPENAPYRLTIYAVVDAQTYDEQPDQRLACEVALNSFLNELRDCPGIEVDENSRVISGAEFTWEETRQTDEWNFANLTDVALAD